MLPHRVPAARPSRVRLNRVDRCDVVAVAARVRRQEVRPGRGFGYPAVDELRLEPVGLQIGEVFDAKLWPRLVDQSPTHERGAPNQPVVAPPVVAVPHAAVDSHYLHPTRYLDVPGHFRGAAEQREKVVLATERRRHLIHNSARRSRDSVLAQLAQHRQLPSAFIADELDVG